MGSTSLTIRIDEDMKRAIEQAAQAEDRTTTDFLIRAARLRINAQCQNCGRSDASGPLPAGLSSEMDGFLALVRRDGNLYTPILITTIERGEPHAYNGTLNPERQKDEEHRGTVGLLLRRNQLSLATLSLPIPRGLITGWDFDQDGKRYSNLVRLGGYVDGNGLAFMRAQGWQTP
jgi:hypothetical protein